MRNELLLIASLLLIYGAVLLAYRFFGKSGLYCWTVFATVTANIEVLLLVDAFGMEQTLGNVMFASTFLVTDILSENCGKKDAQTAVNIGVCTSLVFILISQMWLWYIPSVNNQMTEAFHTIFSNTPRIMIASFLVYAVTQRFDVWAYHKWWEYTKKRFGDSSRFLWLRNNGSTLISQFLNAVLYSFAAFAGTYELDTVISIALSGYLIFIVTSLADTPFVYVARKLCRERQIQ